MLSSPAPATIEGLEDHDAGSAGPVSGDSTARARRRATRPAGPPASAAPAPVDPTPQRPASASRRRVLLPVAVALLIVAAGMWLVKQREDSQAALREQYIETARQMVLNLETIHPDTADGDDERITAGASGELARQLQRGLNPLTRALRQDNASSDGRILEAGLEAVRGDDATVLVASTMTLQDNSGRASSVSFRTRVTVHNDHGSMTVSNSDSF
jgi:Mce-associated membrane protein